MLKHWFNLLFAVSKYISVLLLLPGEKLLYMMRWLISISPLNYYIHQLTCSEEVEKYILSFLFYIYFHQWYSQIISFSLFFKFFFSCGLINEKILVFNYLSKYLCY